MDNLITIFLTITLFVGILGLIYALLYNNLQASKIKINEAENIIDELLRKKFDLLEVIKTIIIDNTDINDKNFEQFDNLKTVNISSYDFERKLTEYNILINQMKDDYSKLEELDAFNNNYEDIFKLNERLEATKTFYNRYTTILNKAIKKFPSNIIAKIHHLDPQTFFDGKDMFDDDKEDFKI
ncbi:MAG: LemA family protein [Bacilli bacterium]|nr:LemA family protein [Bacilli bacterium]MDD4795473.1 LemA family protein [Bacilli bacterium]